MSSKWTVLWVPFTVLASLIAGCSVLDGGSLPAQETEENPEPATIVITVETIPSNSEDYQFQFIGVPEGSVSESSTLVAGNLNPGTYTTTQLDPEPEYDLTAVECDDADSAFPSSGDPATRSAVLNVDSGETVTCVFTNTRRATAVIHTKTLPTGTDGRFQYTGIPEAINYTGESYAEENLAPGTYIAMQADPAPRFDVTRVNCDDSQSQNVSHGDPVTRTAVFQLDPGEVVRCTFINTRRGSAIVNVEMKPRDDAIEWQFAGIPQGSISGQNNLLEENLGPGTYLSTALEGPDSYELIEVTCDDEESETPSSGDSITRTAIFGIDPGERVNCIFHYEIKDQDVDVSSTDSGSRSRGGDQGDLSEDINPFESPDEYLDGFRLPAELPPEAGTVAVPLSGPWIVEYFEGTLDCGGFVQTEAAPPAEQGVLEVLEAGQRIEAIGIGEIKTAVFNMNADDKIVGRYVGVTEFSQSGRTISVEYAWQVVDVDFMIGKLTSSATSQGVTCTFTRPYTMTFDG